jgi:hypothetical protein
MTFVVIVASVQCLERLSIGPAMEIVTWEECNDPLLYRERQDYLQGIPDTQSRIETARVAMVHAKQRLAVLTDGG